MIISEKFNKILGLIDKLNTVPENDALELRREVNDLRSYLIPDSNTTANSFVIRFNEKQIEKLSLILKNVRYRISLENAIPVWKIFNNIELEKLLKTTPMSKEEFFSIYRGSKYQYDLFGKYIVKEIEDFYNVENEVVSKFDDAILDKMLVFSDSMLYTNNHFNNLTNYRDVDINQGFSRRGEYFSNKNNKLIPYESELERKFMMILEYSIKVKSYVAQPLSIRFQLSYKLNGKPYSIFRKSYIPDFLIIFEDNRNCIVEVKNYYDFCSVKNKLKNEVLKQYCKEKGFGYLTTTNCKATLEDAISFELNSEFIKDFDKMCESSNDNPSIRNYVDIRKKYTIDNHWILPLCYQKNLYIEGNAFHRIEDIEVEIIRTWICH